MGRKVTEGREEKEERGVLKESWCQGYEMIEFSHDFKLTGL